MSEAQDKDDKDEGKKTLSLGGGKGTLSLGKNVAAAAPARQNIAQGRGRTIAVEVQRSKRAAPGQGKADDAGDLRHLTDEEREARLRALRGAEETAKRRQEELLRAKDQPSAAPDTGGRTGAVGGPLLSAREREMEEMRRIEADERKAKDLTLPGHTQADTPGFTYNKAAKKSFIEDEEEEESYRSRMKRTQQQQKPQRRNPVEDDRRNKRMTVTQALNEDFDRDSRGPSLAAQRRAREKARMAASQQQDQQKMVREVVVPEVITVQELSNRMAEKSGDLIKALMKMGVMATINQSIDPDTAELLIVEFGHKIKRVTDADIEEGIEGPQDNPEDMQPRPPVVTIMGHVDHGKTSLLDALRQTDVVSGEAGGITQHIGAYQVTMSGGDKITFLDTPGHAAFTEMRARGANVTDIVVLVVAANDSIMPQTIEAINHAKAAKVPLIIAINKIDLPDANVQKVKTDLLQHEIMVEGMGGDTLCIEVSAKQKKNLDKLEEAILLQSEILDLKANPDRLAVGAVVEARLEQGRGHVATVLVQAGTLRIGDIFVVGAEWGRVRALVNDRGQNVTEAIPGQPVEVLGLQGAPEAGDSLVVLNDERRAVQISTYRQRKRREIASIRTGGSSFEEILAHARDSQRRKELAVIIRGDVHGSVEAIIGSLMKIQSESDEISVRVLHSGVGAITESDVILARASNALIIGFNVRANAQARVLAEKDKVDIRYYNIIYNVIDDAKAVLSGLLSPAIREVYLGQAEIRQVFNITKVGKVAGCMVTAGAVKRGAKVRLLRDSVVIHDSGTLKTLKRFKDEVKEVKEGMECGMAFENYDDIKEGDVIECFEVVEEARTLA